MTKRRARGALHWRRAGVWLPIALLAGAALTPACGPEFTSCEAHRSCPPAKGGAGGRGGAGEDAGAANSAGHGGSTGDAGMNAGGASAGSAGEGGASEPEAPCAVEGAVECAEAASPWIRTCTKHVWVAEPCDDGSLCDGSDQTCKPVLEECADKRAGDAFCEGDKRRVCGPDLVTTTEQVCDGACLDGSCRKPACGDGKLESGESCDDANVEAGDGCSATCRVEPIAVELGDAFGCALLADRRLKCWGENSFGELGLGDVLARGDAAGELGTNLKETLNEVSAFAVGARHACAVSKSETWCWGNNAKYALGTGSLTPQFSRVPVKVAVGATPLALAAGEDFTCALVAGDRSLRCWGNNVGDVFGVVATYLPTAPQAALPRLVLGSGATELAAGLSLCANAPSGLICSGSRFPSAAFGVDLGGDFELAGVRSSSTHDCAWSAAGDVKCWGAAAAPLGLNGAIPAVANLATALRVPLVETVSALDVGVNATCAILGDGKVECWGSTATGALGRPELGTTIGATPYLGDEAGEMAKLLPLDLGTDGLAQAISVGRGFACALLQRGALKCWGNNASGQLGHGDSETCGDELGEMGDALPETELD